MICECGEEFNEKGVCQNCGMCSEEPVFGKTMHYPYDEDAVTQHGDMRGLGVVDLAVMTKVNSSEATGPDMKRIIKKDSHYNWRIQQFEILKGQIRRLCREFNLERLEDNCWYFVRKIPNYKFTGKKLEEVGIAIFYLVIRLNGLPYTLYEFKTRNYNVIKIYRYYTELVVEFKLYKKIKSQDPTLFITKIVNSLVPTMEENKKQELILEHVLPLFRYWQNARIGSNIVDVAMVNSNSGLNMVGAILYIAFKKREEKITQNDVAELCGCSVVTLRKYVKEVKLFVAAREKAAQR